MLKLKAVGQVTHILSTDPGIDRENPDFNWDKFLETGDEKYCPALPGEKLTKFKLRRLPHKHYLALSDKEGVDLVVYAVKYGLKAVENYEINGEPVELRFRGEGQDKHLHDETIALIFDPQTFTQLGERIVIMSTLRPL